MLIKKDPAYITNYLEDSSNLKGGHAEEVVLPESAEEVSAFLKEANRKKIPVTVSGGGTSTAGGRIPFGGVVISLEKLNSILAVSQEDMCLSAESGCLVEDVKSAAEKKGMFYTSHPTEKTSFIGGTIATNASGARSFKYGPTRRYVKRLKMALASGEVLDIRRGEKFITKSGSRVRFPGGPEIEIPLPTYRMPDVKNSAGYYAGPGMDLIDLFIGQEGTLSVITEAELALVKKPSGIFSCFVFFKNEPDAWGFAFEARDLSRRRRPGDADMPDALSIEYFDRNALRLLGKRSPNIPNGANAAIFFEQELSGKGDDPLVDSWLGLISAHGSSPDNTWVAMNEKEAEDFSQFRYAIPESVNDIIRHRGFQKLSTDIAVPDSRFPEMMRFYTDALSEVNVEYVIFGHIGESHVHVNMLPKSEGELEKAARLALEFAGKASALRGTVSAEHGIGKIKHRYLEIMYGRKGILEMARIKKALDPNCILGLDNIFPKELLEEV